MDTCMQPLSMIPAQLSDNARTVLAKRYLIKDAAGNPTETPEDMFARVATVIAEVDRRYGATSDEIDATAAEFYALMTQRRFEPNSPTFTGAGRSHGMLSACFVLPIDDALSNGRTGIYDSLRNTAAIHQSGGGTGFSLSRIRATGSMVRSSTGVASGPVSFMSLFDKSTDVVKQGGTRRGANMGILRVDHPDIEEFIACKQDITKLVNFNISVAVTDVFMHAVESDSPYDLIDPRTGRPTKQLRARDVWEAMIAGAWKTGEPGVFFIDEANRYNPVPHLGAYEATNPCGEQPLLPFDVCNLGSVNVGYYVIDGVMNWDALARDIRVATHFLDNVIDANRYPLPEIDSLAKRIRRIGLGVMGFADALIRLGIPYDSVEGVAFGQRLMQFLDDQAKSASAELAITRSTFPEWAQSIWGPDETCARDADGQRVRPMQLLRNCNITTVAPTGTISIFAGCSSGLEPLFAVAFMRNQAGVKMPDVNEDFLAIAKREGWYSEALMARIAETGSVNHADVPAQWQRVFVTANAIAPEWHIKMQAAFQAHCDSAISKTTNFAHTATVDDVRTIYEMAWRSRCKGVTVYRDGSRDGQVLSTGATAKAADTRQGDTAATQALADLREEVARLTKVEDDLHRRLIAQETESMAVRRKRVRPAMLQGHTFRQTTPLGEMFVNITHDAKGQPFEVFISLGKAGGSAMADAEALGRLISLCLRSGIPLAEVHKQIRGISSDRAVGMGPNKVMSMPDAVGISLEQWQRLQEGVQGDLLAARTSGPIAVAAFAGEHVDEVGDAAFAMAALSMSRETQLTGACPECGSQLEFAEGCKKCVVCAFSECG
jgi:ribonucleoside-diphosphate reductase alpha chain